MLFTGCGVHRVHYSAVTHRVIDKLFHRFITKYIMACFLKCSSIAGVNLDLLIAG